MPIYRAPVEDFRFLFHEMLELEKHRDLPGFEAAVLSGLYRVAGGGLALKGLDGAGAAGAGRNGDGVISLD